MREESAVRREESGRDCRRGGARSLEGGIERPGLRTRVFPARRGFTLLESLLAAGILLIIVVAITAAVTAGQHHGYEAQQQISGTLAAEELMGRLTQVRYNELPLWDNHREEVGEMRDMLGDPMPHAFIGIGRRAFVTDTVTLKPASDLNILGRTVRVQAFDAYDQVLADIQRFVPYPSAALPDPDDDVLLADATEIEEGESTSSTGGGGLTTTISSATSTLLGGSDSK